jgi:hypothetical protein
MPQNLLRKPLLIAVAIMSCAGCDSEDDGDRILIGNTNVTYELDQLQYQDQFVVQVSDPDGAPSANSIVTLQLTPLSYNKGRYIATDDRWEAEISAVCASEDTNDNGALEPVEDINGNGVLDPDVPTLTAHPEKTPTIAPGSNIVVTDASGFGYFAITYPKSEALWSKILVTAEASDSLPGNTATYELTLPVLIKDISDLTTVPPGGVTSPYGVADDCTNPA